MKNKIKNILVVLIIILGVVGVWFVKNKGDNQFEIENDNVIESENNSAIEDIAENNNEEKNELEVLENNDEEVESEVIENKDEEEKSNGVNEENISDEIDVNDPNFELSTPSFDIDTLTAYGLPILLDFGAQWCGPCQLMHPILEELNSELRGKAIVKYVDVDEYPEATKGFSFSLIPTQFFITKDGEIYKTHTGVLENEDAIKILEGMGMKQ